MRLLSHVLVLPYRHPLLAAKAFATLDALSGGRAIIGAGSGHLKPEFRSLGVDHDARAAISDEYLRALAAALEQEVSSFAGQFVRWRDMMVAPRPVQRPRPPIWVGGNSAARWRAAPAATATAGFPWQIAPAEFAARAAAARARTCGERAQRAVRARRPAGGRRVDDPAALRATIEHWRRPAQPLFTSASATAAPTTSSRCSSASAPNVRVARARGGGGAQGRRVETQRLDSDTARCECVKEFVCRRPRDALRSRVGDS